MLRPQNLDFNMGKLVNVRNFFITLTPDVVVIKLYFVVANEWAYLILKIRKFPTKQVL